MGITKMENVSFQRDVEEGTELGLVRLPKSVVNGARSTVSATSGPSSTCRPDICQAARRRYQPPDLSDSPWHRFKTIALLATIVLLIIWIIVFTVLSQLNLL